MQLRNTDYTSLVKKVKENNSRIIVYGAGMIGQIIVPYLVRKYNLYSHIDCFIDTDKRKKGQKIYIDNYIYEIKNTDYLEENKDNQIILITNSKYSKVLEFLDNIQTLESTDGYIVPIMQLHEIEENNNCIIIEKKYKTQLIPKKIHYCWFGKNELPTKAKKCIASWKKYCPDYEIVEWNEDNYDVHQNAYTTYTYDNKKFAFLSDYARLQIILREGGIYFDVDVEVVRSLDELLRYPAFFGFETEEYVNTGVGFGAEIGNKIVEGMLNEYNLLLDGKHGTRGCPILNTEALEKKGLIRNGQKQQIEGAQIFPVEYFNPYDDPTGRLNKTTKTYSIHWFAKSWMGKKEILRSQILKPVHRIFGKDVFRRGK